MATRILMTAPAPDVCAEVYWEVHDPDCWRPLRSSLILSQAREASPPTRLTQRAALHMPLGQQCLLFTQPLVNRVALTQEKVAGGRKSLRPSNESHGNFTEESD